MNPQKMTPLFNVEDIARSTEFYRQLDFAVEETWSEGKSAWCFMSCGELGVMLNQTKRSRSDLGRRQEDYSDLVIYLYVDDAEQFLSEHPLTDARVRHVGPQHYGLDEVWIRDPDGYHIVVTSDVKEKVRSAV